MLCRSLCLKCKKHVFGFNNARDVEWVYANENVSKPYDFFCPGANKYIKEDDAPPKKCLYLLEQILHVEGDSTMATVKNVIKFRYTGKAYNVLSSGAENGNVGTTQNLFDGLVHPDYHVYINDGTVRKVSELEPDLYLLDRESKLWKVEKLLEYQVDEDFLEFEFTDGRRLKCSQNHKLLVTSPRKILANDLGSGDIISDVSIGAVGKRVKQFKGV